MNISFHGAAHCVTGSKHLLELEKGTKILLDCGMFQGNPKEADQLNRVFGFDPSEIDFLLLSHAHIDHCGLIPKLVNDGFRGQIYCTDATYDLTAILLRDSAKIQRSDIAYHNKKRAKKGEKPVEALYTEEDVEHCLTYFRKVDYHQWIHLNEEASFYLTDAGHIIGSTSVHVKIKYKEGERILSFSGDVGRYNDEILKQPESFPQADYLILESTYGDSLHEDTALSDKRLLDIIVDTCLKKKGNLIIPAFSVGRTQELVYAFNRLDIANQLPPINFYVDSPLSVQATEVVKKHSEYYNEKLLRYMKRDENPFDFSRLQYITEAEDSKALNSIKEPCVIISASGMADAGRVKHHIKHNIGSNRNTILLVGYCEPNSLGGKLMRGQTAVTIFGEPFDVRAEIQTMRSMSAHGDRDDLLRYIQGQDPAKLKALFLVHGEYDVQLKFADKLKDLGYNSILVPAMHEKFQL